MEKKAKKVTKKDNKLRKEIVFYTTPIIIIIYMIIFFSITIGIVTEINTKVILFTYTILMMIHIMLTIVMKSSKKSFLLQSILITILLIINKFKFLYTNEPITFFDFKFNSNIGKIFELIEGSIGQNIFNNIFLIIGIITTNILLYIFESYNNIKIEIKRKNKIIIISTILIALIILINPPRIIKDFILKNIYDIGSEKDYAHKILNVEYYSENTILGGMYKEYLESKISKPKDYKKEELEKELEDIDIVEEKNKFEKSNIIVTFSESFFDISKLSNDIKFNKEVTSNYNKLKDKGICSQMISPSYGGISSNVEFELLTGYSLNYFSKGYIPFMSLYKDDKYSNRPTLLKELKNNGYYTKIVFGRDYYNSKNVYNRLGIDEYEELIDKPDGNNFYVSDKKLIDKTIETFKNKKKDEKLFYMNCTIESHMPFIKEKYNNYDIEIIDSKLNNEEKEIMESYAQSCYNADKELGRLYDYIQTLDEPTILIFFGDHLPYLRLEDKDILTKGKYFNTEDELLNMYRKYNTEALILANYDIKEFKNMEYISPDMLLTSVMNNMKINLSPYYRWLYSTKDKYPSSNIFISQDNEGKIYWTKQIKGEMLETYKKREKMQYMTLLEK